MSVVTINIGDKTSLEKRKFTIVSYTVDRDDVIQKIEELRKKFRITPSGTCCHHNNTSIPKNYFSDKILMNPTDSLVVWFGCKYLKAYSWYRNSNNGKLDNGEANKLIDHTKNTPALIGSFEDEIRNFCLKKGISERMERLIAHATICNLVNEDDIYLVYAVPKEEDMQTNDDFFATTSGFLMTISHDASKKDVIEAYERDVRPFQMAIKEDVDVTIPVNGKRDVVYGQFKVRNWYVRHKNGETIPTFAKENDPNCLSANEETSIRKAIERYGDELKNRSKTKRSFSSYPTPQLPE